MFNQLISLGGKEHLLESVGLGEVTLRFFSATAFGRDHSRVQKEACILSALCQSSLNMVPGFSEPSRGCQRPSHRLVREDIRAHREFLLRKTKRQRKSFTSGCEKERESSRITNRAAQLNFVFEHTGFILAASAAQCFGKCPLVFGQRIQSRRALQRSDGFDEFLLSQQDAPFCEQRGRVVRQITQRRAT